MRYLRLNQPALTIEEAAENLSTILETLPFEDELKNALRALKINLDNSTLSAEDYFKSPSLKDAISVIEPATHFSFVTTFKLWWNQPHQFERYEKIFLALSSIFLLASFILSYEVFTLFFDGKPRLKDSGDGIKGYCTGSLDGLATEIVNVAEQLPDGMSAIFNMNKKITSIPTAFYNSSLTESTSGVQLEKVASWFDPIAWSNSYAFSREGNDLQLRGDAYCGTIAHAEEKAAKGFKVISSAISMVPDSISNLTISAGIQLFLGAFCILVQEGGTRFLELTADEKYTPVQLHLERQEFQDFNGFERFGDQFEGVAFGFADIYAGVTIVAFLAMLVLQAKKALTKWDESCFDRFIYQDNAHALRGHAPDMRTACRLFDKFAPKSDNDVVIESPRVVSP